MNAFAQTIVESSPFRIGVGVVIVCAGILAGFETYADLAMEWRHVLSWLHRLVLGLFILEIFLKATAELPAPWRFFTDAWNCFDFAIIVGCCLPVFAPYAVWLPMLRMLRVLAYTEELAKAPFLTSGPSRVASTLLAAVPPLSVAYVFSVIGSHLFGHVDPYQFGDLDNVWYAFLDPGAPQWHDDHPFYTITYGCGPHNLPPGRPYPGPESCPESDGNWMLAQTYLWSSALTFLYASIRTVLGVRSARIG